MEFLNLASKPGGARFRADGLSYVHLARRRRRQPARRRLAARRHARRRRLEPSEPSPRRHPQPPVRPKFLWQAPGSVDKEKCPDAY